MFGRTRSRIRRRELEYEALQEISALKMQSLCVVTSRGGVFRRIDINSIESVLNVPQLFGFKRHSVVILAGGM